MGRKNQVKDFVSINGSMSSASLSGASTTVNQFDVLNYLVTWTDGQLTNGEISIQVSLDNLKWVDLDFGSVISINGSTGNHQLLISEVSFNFARPVFTRTNPSATGALKVELFATNKGA